MPARARQVLPELAEAKLMRAVYSERQLEEVLVDFWFNHFNVFARKGQTEIYVGEYERKAIRPHVLGNFRDLLGATAKSPAMLVYLDNWMSADPDTASHLETVARRGAATRDGSRRPGSASARRGTPIPPDGRTQGRMARGLNENYARELLELHTSGVDGGYTQEDVVAVARAFTGWTIGRPDRPRIPLRAEPARSARENRSRADDRGRQRRRRRRDGSRYPGAPPGDRTASFLQAGTAVRERRSAAGPRRSRRTNIPAHERQPA